MSGQRGQASVEVVAFLPLVALIGVIAFTMLASHTAGEQAGEAAEAGALMLLQGGGDPHDAARKALPRSMRSRATITITGKRVHVVVRPRLILPIPGLADHLSGEAQANAGTTR